MNILEATDISISYHSGHTGNRVLIDGMELSLRAGSLTAIIGANGAGKSSLLRVLTGLQEPTRGEVFWMGVPLREIAVKHRPRYTAALFRDFARVYGLTVYDLAAMGAEYGDKGRSWFAERVDKQKVDEALELTTMTALAQEPLGNLSDGELQKAMIAKLLVQDAPIMILDEPTTHLDLPSAIELMQLLAKLAAERGKTILYTSHHLDLVLRLAHCVILLGGDGSWVSGTPDSVSSHRLMCSFLRTDKVSIRDGQIHYNINNK